MNPHTEFARVKATPDGRLTRREAAKFIGVAERTLANWRSKGLGPRQAKVGGRVFYRIEELKRFVDAETAQ